MNSTAQKTLLRQRMRAQRSQLTEEFCQFASQQIIQQLIQLPEVHKARHIALYWPSFNECNPLLLRKELTEAQTYLPVITSEQLLAFYPYQEGDTLVNNRFNILEPNTKNKQSIATNKLELILIPLLGFDEKANRLGMGGGYYDRSLSLIKKSHSSQPLLIGLAYEFQKLDQIPTDSWDVPLDYVATELSLYRRISL